MSENNKRYEMTPDELKYFKVESFSFQGNNSPYCIATTKFHDDEYEVGLRIPVTPSTYNQNKVDGMTIEERNKKEFKEHKKPINQMFFFSIISVTEAIINNKLRKSEIEKNISYAISDIAVTCREANEEDKRIFGINEEHKEQYVVTDQKGYQHYVVFHCEDKFGSKFYVEMKYDKILTPIFIEEKHLAKPEMNLRAVPPKIS